MLFKPGIYYRRSPLWIQSMLLSLLPLTILGKIALSFIAVDYLQCICFAFVPVS